MGLVTVLGGFTSAITMGQGWGDYGAGPSTPQSLLSYWNGFSLPSAGYVQYFSISTSETPTAPTNIVLNNRSASTTFSSFILTPPAREGFYTHTPTDMTFNSGNLMRVGIQGGDLPGDRTSFAWHCELTTSPYDDGGFFCITASFTQAGLFVTGRNPFSFGARASADNGGNAAVPPGAIMRIPVNCELLGTGIVASENGLLVSTAADVGYYVNSTLQETATIPSLSFNSATTFGASVGISAGSDFNLQCENTSSLIDKMVVTSVFRIG